MSTNHVISASELWKRKGTSRIIPQPGMRVLCLTRPEGQSSLGSLVGICQKKFETGPNPAAVCKSKRLREEG
jgi:hypothetical protein